MKKHNIMVTLLVLVLASGFYPVNMDVKEQEDVLNEVQAAIKMGSSKELVKHVNTRIDLEIDGSQSSYSDTQVEFVLKDFFKKYPPSNFEFIHRGTSKDGLKYAIGRYSHNGGEFRVVLRYKKFAEEYKIYNLGFNRV